MHSGTLILTSTVTRVCVIDYPEIVVCTVCSGGAVAQRVESWTCDYYYYYYYYHHHYHHHYYKICIAHKFKHAQVGGAAIYRSWVQFLLDRGKSCVTTLGKLFTPMCLCHQAV